MNVGQWLTWHLVFSRSCATNRDIWQLKNEWADDSIVYSFHSSNALGIWVASWMSIDTGDEADEWRWQSWALLWLIFYSFSIENQSNIAEVFIFDPKLSALIIRTMTFHFHLFSLFFQ